MITAGIDVGARTCKIIVLQDGKVLAYSLKATGVEEKEGIEAAFNEVIAKAGIKKEDLHKIVSTGMGAGLVDIADENITVNIADAKGMFKLFPEVKTIIDIGAEEGRTITTEAGVVTAYVINDRCASGAGTFIDNMARILEVTPQEFGEMALKTENLSQISAQCSIFAESEVISLVSSDKSKEEIARAVVNAVAERANSLANRLTIKPDVALIGGTAKNKGFADLLTKALKLDQLIIPEEPEFVAALGAAVHAQEL